MFWIYVHYSKIIYMYIIYYKIESNSVFEIVDRCLPCRSFSTLIYPVNSTIGIKVCIHYVTHNTNCYITIELIV